MKMLAIAAAIIVATMAFVVALGGLAPDGRPWPAQAQEPTPAPAVLQTLEATCVVAQDNLNPRKCKYTEGEAFTIGGSVQFRQDLNGDTIAGYHEAEIEVSWDGVLAPFKSGKIFCPGGGEDSFVGSPRTAACTANPPPPFVDATTFAFTLNCNSTSTGPPGFAVLVKANVTREDGTAVPDEKIPQDHDEMTVGVECNPSPDAGVGGIAELPDVELTPLEASEASGPGTGMWAGVAGAVMVMSALGGLGGAAWYTRRRWLK